MKSNLGRGKLNTLFGRGGGQALAGRASRGLTALGVGASLSAGVSDWKGCEKKCEAYKPWGISVDYEDVFLWQWCFPWLHFIL